MSTKKTDLTNSEKILNSDIYDLTEFVDDIKKININGVGSDKETLLVGMYGYLGYEFTSLLQNAIDFSDVAIVVISRLGGENNDLPYFQLKNTTGKYTDSDTLPRDSSCKICCFKSSAICSLTRFSSSSALIFSVIRLIPSS